MQARKLPQSSLRASRTPGQSWVNGLFPLLPLDRWSRPEQEGGGSVGNLQWLQYVVRMVNRHFASQGLAVKTKNSVWTHSMRECWISVFGANENRELLWISIPVACHCEQWPVLLVSKCLRNYWETKKVTSVELSACCVHFICNMRD